MGRVVVVGGSIAALTAVETLRVEGFGGSITMLSDEALPPYTRVPLSKDVLAGRRDLEEILLGPLGDEVDLRLETKATALDLDERVVITSNGAVPFDGLVIATGAHARRLADDDGALAMRSHNDCVRLRSALESTDSVLIVGGGFLGMEIASTCTALAKRVTVVDLAPPLERLLGPTVAAHVRSVAEGAGMEIVVASGGLRPDRSSNRPAMVTSDGRRMTADVIVSAVGDLPNVDWLNGSGLPLNGGVQVDEHCRARADIVAAGDVAVMRTRDGGFVRCPSWTNAVEQSRAAARSLLYGDEAPPYTPSNYFWTEQFGLNIKMIGPPGPQGTPDTVDGSLAESSALLAWPHEHSPRNIIAINHHVRPAKLKRMVGPIYSGAGI